MNEKSQGYFYHGFEDIGYYSEQIQYMIDIINSGFIKKRNEAIDSPEDSLAHICLYKKNDDFDYTKKGIEMLNSARAGWIDNCYVFVISNDITATHTPFSYTREEGTTNLVDEWRTTQNIPMDKIIGIALPLNEIKSNLNKETSSLDESEIEELKMKLTDLKELCHIHNFRTFNSNEPNFTDKLDASCMKKDEEDKKINDDSILEL